MAVKTPVDFAWDYMRLPIHTERDGLQHVSVARYLSGGMYDNSQDRQQAYKALWNFIKFGKNEKGEKRYKEGYFFAPTLQPTGALEISLSTVRAAFSGKGTPAAFQKVVTIIDFYLNHSRSVKKLFGPKPPLQTYVDTYLGIDCNGFVGAYFKTQYPDIGLHPGLYIPAFKTKGGAKKRKTPAELKPLDVLVREGGKGVQHVAVIEDVLSRDSTKAEVLIVQSASSKKGIDWDVFTLKDTGKYKLKCVGHITYDYAVGYSGVHSPLCKWFGICF